MGAIVALAVLLGTLSYGQSVEPTESGSTVLTPAMPKSPTVSLLPVPSGASPPDALICVIRDFYPKSLRVTWRVNGKNLTGSASTWQAEKQASGLFSASSIVNVDRTIWDRNEEYTCEVWHQQETIEQKISRGLKAPKVVIYTTSEEEDSEFVSLVCVVTGFSPRDVSVMWTVDDGSYEEGITSEPVESKHGTFSVTSFLEVPTAKWKSRSKVACNVKHVSVANGAVTITKSVSRATDQSSDTPYLEVTLNPPKTRELFVNDEAVLDCVITGGERAAVEGASVTWTPSGTGTSIKESQITQQGDLFRKTSTLTLERKRRFTEQNVQCSVQQNSNKLPIKKSFSWNNSASKVPEVVLITPIKQDSEFVTLVCVVTAFSPWNVFVMWKVGEGTSYKEGITSEPVKCYDGTYSVTSLFKVSTADWNFPSKVTCNAKHISMPNGATPITKSVSRATGNSNECD